MVAPGDGEWRPPVAAAVTLKYSADLRPVKPPRGPPRAGSDRQPLKSRIAGGRISDRLKRFAPKPHGKAPMRTLIMTVPVTLVDGIKLLNVAQ
jgi:hypothetical protein